MSRSETVIGAAALVLLVLAPAPVRGQGQPVLKWHTYAGTPAEDQARGVAVDASGNIYLAGWSDATWGSPILPHSGARDTFVAKLRSTGELEWNTFLGPTGDLQANGIAVDGNGDIVVVGTNRGTTPPMGDTWGHFVAKLNSNGDLRWHHRGAATYGGVAEAVAVDAVGNIYVGGWGGCWLAPGVHVGDGGWVAKLDASGADVWHKCLAPRWGGEEHTLSRDLAVDGAGSVYVTGRSTWGWGNPINGHSEDGSEDVYVAKLNVNGDLQWNTFMGASGFDGDGGIALDRSGNVYVSGTSSATWGTPISPFPGGSSSGFAAKLDSRGIRQWHTFMGAIGWAIAVDTGQNVYVAGVWNAPPLTHAGGFVAALNRNGILQWNTLLDAILEEVALGSHHVYAAGEAVNYWGAPVHPPAGGWDAFVAKIGPTLGMNIGSGLRDFDGDTTSDPTVFRPSSGTWYQLRSSTGSGHGVAWGITGDVPVPADYDGDGKADVAVHRPSTGVWYIIRSSTNTAVGIPWGVTGDLPVPADYDGDGKADVAVYRPSTGVWYIVRSSTNTAVGITWGVTDDVPVPADFDGDGQADPTVFRPSTGTWYQLRSTTGTGFGVVWGQIGDVPLPGDYDGDGKADPTVFRPNAGTWYELRSTTGTGYGVSWGIVNDVPIFGDFDGDGKPDPTVFRPSTSTWYQLRSTTGAGCGIVWGQTGDVPM